MKTFFVAVLILVAGIGGLFISYSSRHSMDYHVTTASVQIGSTTIVAEVASTEAARERGLSGRDSLAPGSGMLFVFDHDDKFGFWMKDMKFAIDIVWLDASGTVLTIAPDLSPSTYPNAFYPSRPARYVLEVPAGFAKGHGVAEGSKVVLQ